MNDVVVVVVVVGGRPMQLRYISDERRPYLKDLSSPCQPNE